MRQACIPPAMRYRGLANIGKPTFQAVAGTGSSRIKPPGVMAAQKTAPMCFRHQIPRPNRGLLSRKPCMTKGLAGAAVTPPFGTSTRLEMLERTKEIGLADSRSFVSRTAKNPLLDVFSLYLHAVGQMPKYSRPDFSEGATSNRSLCRNAAGFASEPRHRVGTINKRSVLKETKPILRQLVPAQASAAVMAAAPGPSSLMPGQAAG